MKYSQQRRILWEGHFARAVTLDVDPKTGGDDVIIQVKDPNGWRDGRGFNSISDDYAYTNARDEAIRIERESKK